MVTAELDAYSTVSGWCKYLYLAMSTLLVVTNARSIPDLQAVSEHLKDAILGTSVPFEFEGGHDRVSLDIPRNGTVEGDWSITPLVPLVVSPASSVMR